jgi:hypothetical protein
LRDNHVYLAADRKIYDCDILAPSSHRAKAAEGEDAVIRLQVTRSLYTVLAYGPD